MILKELYSGNGTGTKKYSNFNYNEFRSNFYKYINNMNTDDFIQEINYIYDDTVEYKQVDIAIDRFITKEDFQEFVCNEISDWLSKNENVDAMLDSEFHNLLEDSEIIIPESSYLDVLNYCAWEWSYDDSYKNILEDEYSDKLREIAFEYYKSNNPDWSTEKIDDKLDSII